MPRRALTMPVLAALVTVSLGNAATLAAGLDGGVHHHGGHRQAIAATQPSAEPSPSPSPEAERSPAPTVSVAPGTALDPIPTDQQQAPAGGDSSAPADSQAHRVVHASPDRLGAFTKAPDLADDPTFAQERSTVKRYADPSQHVDLMAYTNGGAIAIAEAYGADIVTAADQQDAVDGFLHGAGEGKTLTITELQSKDAGSFGGIVKCGVVRHQGALVGHICVWADDGTSGSVLVLNDASSKASALMQELRTKVES